MHWFLFHPDPVGDHSRSFPKVIPAGVSFQIAKTSTRGAESESDRRAVESESDRRGVECAPNR